MRTTTTMVVTSFPFPALFLDPAVGVRRGVIVRPADIQFPTHPTACNQGFHLIAVMSVNDGDSPRRHR
jgi:hypothetical protein